MTESPAIFTTYKRADGKLIWGEYAFVTEPEFFEELDEPLDVLKEEWVRSSAETVTFKPFGWDDRDEDDA